MAKKNAGKAATAKSAAGQAATAPSSNRAKRATGSAARSPRSASTGSSAKSAAAANPVVMPAAPTHAEIAQRAYEIWLSKGQPLDQDYQNWVEAVQQLSASR